jgi:hypothetical protein
LAPAPPVTFWSPVLLPIGWVSLTNYFPLKVAVVPLDPPPRQSPLS